MNNLLKGEWKPLPPWIRFLLLSVLLLGVVLRFVHLDREVYWFDEVYTSFRVSGYTAEEMIAETQSTLGNQVLTVQNFIHQLQPYQQPAPAKTVVDTIQGLAKEESQLPPLYFILSRWWSHLFGSSVAAMRSLAAIFSLLSLPCAYWLCRELFEDPLVAWVGMALVAIAPYQLLYAQEARPYSLWILTILLASAALLRALRLQTWGSWAIYALSLTLAFYSFLFSALMAMSHAAYVLFTIRGRSLKTLIGYVGASLLSTLVFLPWLIVVVTNAIKTSPESITPSTWVRATVGNVRRILVDFVTDQQGVPASFNLLLAVPCVLLVGYALYFLMTHPAAKSGRLFVLLLIVVPELVLTASDFALGAMRSAVFRYLMPVHIGIQLAVAFLLATQLRQLHYRMVWQRTWRWILVGVMSLAVVSGVIISQANASWIKYYAAYTPQVADIINQAENPLLLIGSAPPENWSYLSNIMWNGFSLGQWLDPNHAIQLVVEPTVPTIPSEHDSVFLYMPSPSLKDTLSQDYELALVNAGGDLWQITPKRG